MGIRIHKVMGYGIRDLKKKDPRINWKALGDDRHEREDDLKTFLAWAKDHKKKILELAVREYPNNRLKKEELESHLWFPLSLLNQDIEGKKKSSHEDSMVQCVQFDFERDAPKVIVFYPPDCPDWHRYDDTIDYYEAGCVAKEKVRPLFGGIYPYNSGFIRFREPKKPIPLKGAEKALFMEEAKIDGKGPVWFTPADYSMLVGRWDKKQEPLAKGYFLEHLKNDFRPPIPVMLIALVLWSEVATNPAEFLNDLRPMIYTFWR